MVSNESVADRIESVRLELMLSKRDFCTKLGIPYANYTNVFGSRKTKPSLDLVLAIVSRTDIRAEWLLLGKEPRRNLDGVSETAVGELDRALTRYEKDSEGVIFSPKFWPLLDAAERLLNSIQFPWIDGVRRLFPLIRDHLEQSDAIMLYLERRQEELQLDALFAEREGKTLEEYKQELRTKGLARVAKIENRKWNKRQAKIRKEFEEKHRGAIHKEIYGFDEPNGEPIPLPRDPVKSDE